MRSHRCWNWSMRSRCCWRRWRAAVGVDVGTSIRTCSFFCSSGPGGSMFVGLWRSRRSLEFIVEVCVRVLEKDALWGWGLATSG